MTYNNSLRDFGIHPCKIVFCDNMEVTIGKGQYAKTSLKYVVTFEHLYTAARIDCQFDLDANKRMPETKTTNDGRVYKNFDIQMLKDILKAVGASSPKEAIDKKILVLVEPYNWKKNGSSGVKWNPKKVWNYEEYSQYLPANKSVGEVAQAAFDKADETDELPF